MHPGVKLLEDDDTSWPEDFSSIVLCMPDLMRRSAIHQKRKVSVYIHDLSHPKYTDPVFMGAVRLIPTHPEDYSTTGRYQKNNNNDNELVVVDEESTITMQLLEEIPLEELPCHHHSSCYQETISIANREWAVSVLDEEDPNRTRSILAIMIGVAVFTASIGLALWVIANDNRNHRYAAIQSKAAAERTSLILENANNAAKTERELNDFLAHEVRNPLAAAMAATQFLRTELDRSRKRKSTKSIAVHFQDEYDYENDGDSINDNNDDDNDDCDHRQLVSLEPSVQALNCRDSSTKSDTSSRLLQAREDIRVVDHALRFINDLLRNMLDMHRASSSQLQVNMSPVDLLRDILEPVAGMLQRGGERNGSRKSRADDKVKILVDCPENLYVMTDPLRLKQVILNLGRNSVKFIHEGFIRLRAEVVVVVDKNNGTATIKDYDSDDIEASTSTPPNSTVRLYVEDSGSGIPFEKRERLFAKYQESLDLLSQGTVRTAQDGYKLYYKPRTCFYIILRPFLFLFSSLFLLYLSSTSSSSCHS
jgi:signal transduction histidine kinase